MISLLAFLLRFVGIFFIIINLKNKKKVKATTIFIKIISYFKFGRKEIIKKCVLTLMTLKWIVHKKKTT